MDLTSLFKQKRALVIGDFMLDIYTRGSVLRISPEAPVPVLCVEKEESKPGGAGNAVLNLISLGIQVTPVGRVGEDIFGHEFLKALAEENIDCSHVYTDPAWSTTVKKRMIADNQQLLRVDYEKITPLAQEIEQKVILALPKLMQGHDVVAISDYAKGFLTPTLLAAVIECAHTFSIPVIVDPKGIDFKKYRGATVLKPNFNEAVMASGLDRKAPLDLIGKKILEESEVESLMITRSKEGISIFNKEQGRSDFPAFVHEVKDVTGAGDTVLAVIAATIANRVELGTGAYLANVAAGIAIERIGCARVSLNELALRLEQI